MTLEQYIAAFLSEQLSISLKTVITPDSVSLTLDDVTDLNKWQRDSAFIVVISFKKKVDAAALTVAVDEALTALQAQNFIHRVTVDTQRAERVGAPTQWEYFSSISVLHRRRPSWQL